MIRQILLLLKGNAKPPILIHPPSGDPLSPAMNPNSALNNNELDRNHFIVEYFMRKL
jgi:hypothetical protein